MNAISERRPTRDAPPEFSPARISGRKGGPTKKAEDRVIGANVEFYRQFADKYESYEPYLFDKVLQKSLEDDLDKIGSYFAALGRAPSCLECGGGTGNLTLKMCARGWDVTVVDISEHMLDLLKEKALMRGYSPALVRSSIERFLETTDESFDLVAFSSVLHHLYSYASVVEQAASHVRPGGLFYSNWDPTIPRNRFWARAINSIDIAAAKLMLDPGDFLPGIWRRTRKLFRRHDSQFARPVVWAGDLAEYHAKTGVDDAQIVRLLQARGFPVIEHQRFAVGRTAVVRFVNERLRLLESFKIIARRNGEEIQGTKSSVGPQLECEPLQHS
jgi:2-polyprenyl-3-methyl-5-hydroxy-6-metoxy-1,4-benzoquinol methylase